MSVGGDPFDAGIDTGTTSGNGDASFTGLEIHTVGSYTIQASDLGKTKMISQVAAISCLLLAIRHPEVSPIATALMWGVLVFSLASAVDYFRKFWHRVDIQVKERRRRELLLLERRRKRAEILARRAARAAQSGSAVSGLR